MTWSVMLACLSGDPPPPLPDVPGQVHACADAPLEPEMLEGITDPTELALCAGISRQAAHERLKARDITHSEGTTWTETD